MLMFISTVADTDLQQDEIVHFLYTARACFRELEYAISLAVDVENRFHTAVVCHFDGSEVKWS